MDLRDLRMPWLNSPGKSRAFNLFTVPLLIPALAITALGLATYIATNAAAAAATPPPEK